MPESPYVSHETTDKLVLYEALLRKWQLSINLVSPATLDQIGQRHFQDSLQLSPFLGSGQILDMGSGAGFPGMVLALSRPDLMITLIESDQRKCAFLKTVSRETRTPVTILNQRIEQTVPKSGIIAITARALAPLVQLLDYAMPHTGLNPDISMFFLKGGQWQAEMAAAFEKYAFDWSSTPSITSLDGVILHISHLRLR